MTNLTSFAGFDVSKFFFDVCISNQGEQSMRFNYDNKSLASLVRKLPQSTHCVMEATGPYYLKLACYLYEKGFKVSVVNPLVIKRFSQMRLLRTKTDKADAKMIASYAAMEQPALWQPPTRYIVKLRHMEALLHQLEKQRTALLCQTEAFSSSTMVDKEVTQLLKSILTGLQKKIKLIEERMESLIGECYRQEFMNLLSIPGIGKKTAIMLIVATECFKKFDNYKQVSAYFGLSPRIFQSGVSVKGKARICKMGMGKIRALLYLCAWSAKSCNKTCKELYDRLVEKGKSKRLALIAVANKLIKQAFTIVNNKCVYQKDYSKNICF
jgi:transposase